MISSIVWTRRFRPAPCWLVVTAVGRNCYSPVYRVLHTLDVAADNCLTGDFRLARPHWNNMARLSCHAKYPLGAGNYHQPQLPSANMADSDVGTERYSVFMEILSTYFGVWGLYTTEYHVCTFWTPPFDLRIATFAARRWRKNGGLMVIYNTVWW